MLIVVSQGEVAGHQVWGSQSQRLGFTSHLFGYTANCAVTVQADDVEIFSARWLWCTKWGGSDRWTVRSRLIARLSVRLLSDTPDLLDSQLWVLVYCSLLTEAGVGWLGSRPVRFVLEEIILGILPSNNRGWRQEPDSFCAFGWNWIPFLW